MFPDYYPELFITKRKWEYNDISEDEITQVIENSGYKFSRSIHSTIEQSYQPNITSGGTKFVIMDLYEFRKDKQYKFFIRLTVLGDNDFIEYFGKKNGCFVSNIYEGNPLKMIRKKIFLKDIKDELINNEHLEYLFQN